MNYFTLGKNIKKYRRERGFTQENLSEKADISNVFMSQIETATRKPSLETVVKISRALNVSLDLLINEMVNSSEISNYIGMDLTTEQLNIMKFAFRHKSKKDIEALLQAFTFLLDFKK